MISFEEDIKKCTQAINDGGVLLYPTDTVWGIGCSAMDEEAIEKIYKLKNRPKEKSFIILLAEARDIFEYVTNPHPDIVNILEEFDTPITVIYDTPLGFPSILLAEDGSLAIRVTNDPFCKSLIKRLKQPIVSTSANVSGAPTPSVFDLISTEIKDGVDYIVKYRQDDIVPRSPSKIVRIKEDGGIEILRG